MRRGCSPSAAAMDGMGWVQASTPRERTELADAARCAGLPPKNSVLGSLSPCAITTVLVGESGNRHAQLRGSGQKMHRKPWRIEVRVLP